MFEQLTKKHSHTLVSLVVGGYAYLLAGRIGAVIATIWLIGLWVGREQAQAEYRWIEHFGNGRRDDRTFLNSFSPKVWDYHSVVENLLIPVLCSVILTVILFFV